MLASVCICLLLGTLATAGGLQGRQPQQLNKRGEVSHYCCKVNVTTQTTHSVTESIQVPKSLTSVSVNNVGVPFRDALKSAGMSSLLSGLIGLSPSASGNIYKGIQAALGTGKVSIKGGTLLSKHRVSKSQITYYMATEYVVKFVTKYHQKACPVEQRKCCHGYSYVPAYNNCLSKEEVERLGMIFDGSKTDIATLLG